MVHPGTGTIQWVDAFTGDIAGSLHEAGAGVSGVEASPDGGVLYVHAWLDRAVRAYDVSDRGDVPALTWEAPTVEVEPLDAEVLRGKRLFHDSADTRVSKDGYIACASCHPDGRNDGRTWDFHERGEGLRNTASLRGRAGAGMGRVHWSGNFDEIQDFERDIRDNFGGTGFLSDADYAAHEDPFGPPKAGLDPDLDALAAFVSSLGATPTSPHPWSDEGAALFYAVGCAECHPTPPWKRARPSGTWAPCWRPAGRGWASRSSAWTPPPCWAPRPPGPGCTTAAPGRWSTPSPR